jgi:hypothetical protein
MTNDRYYLSLLSGEVEDEMTTAAQPDLLPTTNSDWTDALSEEACRSAVARGSPIRAASSGASGWI